METFCKKRFFNYLFFLFVFITIIHAQLDKDDNYPESQVFINTRTSQVAKRSTRHFDLHEDCPESVYVDFEHEGASRTLQLYHNIDLHPDKVSVIIGKENNFDTIQPETLTSKRRACLFQDVDNAAVATMNFVEKDGYYMNGAFSTTNGYFAFEPSLGSTNATHRIYKIKDFGPQHCSTKDAPTNKHVGHHRHMNRNKRASKSTNFVEIFAAIDYSFYQSVYQDTASWKSEHDRKLDAVDEIRYRASNIFNLVDTIYKGIQDHELSFSVVLQQIYIATDESAAPFSENRSSVTPLLGQGSRRVIDGSDVLVEFTKFMIDNALNFIPYDHATMITRYDLGSLFSTSELGRSYIEKICSENRTSTAEYTGIHRTAHIIAHELGHNLGAYHDGDNNTCEVSDNFLMAPAVGGKKNAENAALFSSCSIEYIRKNIDELNQRNENCLLNRGDVFNETEYQRYLNEIKLGQKYSLDQQCEDLTGEQGSQFEGHLKDVCQKIKCKYIENRRLWFRSSTTEDRHEIIHYEALDFTTCGVHQWCQNFECVYNETAPDVSLDEQCQRATRNKDAKYREVLQDVCHTLHCWTPTQKHRKFHNIVLDFTPCGMNSWCRNSTCVRKNDTEDHESTKAAETTTTTATSTTSTTTSSTTPTTEPDTTTTTTMTTTTTSRSTLKTSTTAMETTAKPTLITTPIKTSQKISPTKIYTNPATFIIPFVHPECHSKKWRHRLKHKLLLIHSVRHPNSSIHILHCKAKISEVSYDILDDSPFTDLKLSMIAAELYNAIDPSTRSLVIHGVPYALTRNPSLLLDSDTIVEITDGCSYHEFANICLNETCALNQVKMPYCRSMKQNKGPFHIDPTDDQNEQKNYILIVLATLLAALLVAVVVMVIIIKLSRYVKSGGACSLYSQITTAPYRVEFKKSEVDEEPLVV